MSTVEAPASHLPLPMQNILSRLAANSTEAEQALVRKAYAYAAAAHAGQVRLSGEPYLSHPLAVAEVLAELGFDAHSVAAGLLHDTVEDTKVTLEEVDAEFGEQVADIVDGVTKISMMTFDSKEEQQAENIRKMILAMSHDIRVPIVKLADRVHNMRTLDFQKAHKRQRIAQETMDIYVPLANRLGLHRLKLELEGLSFKYIHPDVYAQISDWLESNQVVERQLIAKIIAKLEGQRTELQTQLASLPRNLDRNHPTRKSLQQSLEAVERQIAREHSKLASTSGKPLNSLVEEEQRLELDLRFKQDLYKASLVGLEKGRMDAARTLKQVSVLQKPVLPEYAWEPRRIYGVVATVCITLLVIGIINLLKAVILDHVD